MNALFATIRISNCSTQEALKQSPSTPSPFKIPLKRKAAAAVQDDGEVEVAKDDTQDDGEVEVAREDKEDKKQDGRSDDMTAPRFT